MIVNPAPESDSLGVPAQNAIAYGVKRSSPDALRALWQQRGDATEHFPRRLVREGQQQDAPRGHALLEKPRHPISQSACLSAAGARNDKSRARREVTAASCCALSSAA